MALEDVAGTSRFLAKDVPTVAGRCKPMRIEKRKTNRVHKVKQGRRPTLSTSQIRKLVRLYMYTDLPWKAISTLVLHFGLKDMK